MTFSQCQFNCLIEKDKIAYGYEEMFSIRFIAGHYYEFLFHAGIAGRI